MSSQRPRNWDVLAVIAAVIAATMAGLYVGIIKQQEGDVAAWFVAGLAVAVVLALYGAVRSAPRRTPALAVSGGLMAVLGLLGILTIGLPILAAGALALAAAGRAGRSVSAGQSG
jgi:hypothetical protein